MTLHRPGWDSNPNRRCEKQVQTTTPQAHNNILSIWECEKIWHVQTIQKLLIYIWYICFCIILFFFCSFSIWGYGTLYWQVCPYTHLHIYTSTYLHIHTQKHSLRTLMVCNAMQKPNVTKIILWCVFTLRNQRELYLPANGKIMNNE